MIRRRYTIEASVETLGRFCATAEKAARHRSFIEKLAVSQGDEYYYVTLYGAPEVHDALKADRFTNSHPVNQIPKGRVQ